MIRIAFSFLLLCLNLLPQSVLATSSLEPSVTTVVQKPLLVQKLHKSKNGLPKRFRTSGDAIDGKVVGDLRNLRMAASGQYSRSSLKNAVMQIQKTFSYVDNLKITVIDLRQESHGFIDGEQIYWYFPYNTINRGKSDEAILKDEKTLLEDLKKQPTQHISLAGKNDEKDGEVVVVSEKHYQTSDILSEEELCAQMNVSYKRIPVADHTAAFPQTIDHYLTFLKARQNNEVFYVHCAGGSGRATTFMTISDIFYNYKSTSVDEIIKRQNQLGGRDLNAMPVKDHPRFEDAKKRLKLIKDFHRYMTKTNGVISFTQWMEREA